MQSSIKKLSELEKEQILQESYESSSCGGTVFRKIGEDTSELLEYVKSSLKVIRNIRPRCVCTKCDKINKVICSFKSYI
jgi:transposase